MKDTLRVSSKSNPPAAATAVAGADRRPGRRLGPSFYCRPASQVAEELIGKILVRRYRRKEYRARIVETEAYVGMEDLASHSSKGRTARNAVMFGPGGCAYVYLIYGMHQMLNVTCGEAQAVLIRAGEPLAGWQADLSGPGKLARALHIQRGDNGVDLSGERLFILDDGAARPNIARSRRIGVDYAPALEGCAAPFLRRRQPGGVEASVHRNDAAIAEKTRRSAPRFGVQPLGCSWKTAG